MALATSVFIAFQIDTELSMQSEGEWFLLSYSTLSWVSFTIMPHCIWDSVKRKEHILLNWQGLFFWLSEHFVIQLFFGDNSFNINSVYFFFSLESPARSFYSTSWKLKTANTKIDRQLLWGVRMLILMWRLQVQGVGGGGNFWWIIAFTVRRS